MSKEKFTFTHISQEKEKLNAHVGMPRRQKGPLKRRTVFEGVEFVKEV